MARILVVDDDQVLQRMIEVILRKEGHTVVIAENGYAALEKLSREVFDLVISDANMPGGLSGFSLVSTIKTDTTLRHIPVIFLTGRGQKSDVVKARQAGVSEYLIKPVKHELLTAKVTLVLAQAKQPKLLVAGDVGAGGVAEFQFRIINLTSLNVELLSPVALPTNFKLKIASELFKEIGLEGPRLQVVSCVSFKDGDEAFKITTAFYDLSEDDRKNIRAWLSGQVQSGKTDVAS